LLPSDTIAVFTVPEYAGAKKKWQQYPGRLLWADPSMKPFKDKFINKLESDLIKPLEKEFGLTLSDYSGLAQGQITSPSRQATWTTPRMAPLVFSC